MCHVYSSPFWQRSEQHLGCPECPHVAIAVLQLLRLKDQTPISVTFRGQRMCKEQPHPTYSLPFFTVSIYMYLPIRRAEIKDFIHMWRERKNIVSKSKIPQEHRWPHWTIAGLSVLVVSQMSIPSALETLLENELFAQVCAIWYLSTGGLIPSS